jgi:hypothetical protein
MAGHDPAIHAEDGLEGFTTKDTKGAEHADLLVLLVYLVVNPFLRHPGEGRGPAALESGIRGNDEQCHALTLRRAQDEGYTTILAVASS